MWQTIFLTIACQLISVILASQVDITFQATLGSTLTLPFLNNEEGSKYELYNRDYENVILKGLSEEYNKFRKGRPCKFLAHGLFESDKFFSEHALKNNFQSCSDVNVITVDWSHVSQNLNIVQVFYESQAVGKALGEKVVELVKAGVCELETAHCIGHSLGAHVCGGAAKEVKRALGMKLFRVTGLDPAGPFYEGNPDAPRNYLWLTDAIFVDAVHTDDFLGHNGPLANADFYVNGGLSPQPGCIPIPGISDFCSHIRAYQVYAKTICKADAYPSTQCGSYDNYEAGRCKGNIIVNMGEYCPHYASGTFYVDTPNTKIFPLL